MDLTTAVGTLVFVGLGSIVLQVGKIVARKLGQDAGTKAVHIGAAVLSGVYLVYTGGFAGIALPVIPAGADVVGWLGWAGAWGSAIALGAAAVAGIYDVALARIYGGLGFK